MAGAVTFTPTEEDVAAATRDWAWRDLLRPRQLWATLAVGAAAATVTVILLQNGAAPPELFAPLAAEAALGGVLLVLLILAIRFSLLPGQARRTFRQNKAIQKEHVYSWSDEGIAWRSASGEARIAWDELHRWREGQHAFMFAVSERSIHFVPCRVLSEAEAGDLRETAKRLGPPLF